MSKGREGQCVQLSPTSTPTLINCGMVTQPKKAGRPCHWPPETSRACTGKTCIFGRVGAKAPQTGALCQASSLAPPHHTQGTTLACIQETLVGGARQNYDNTQPRTGREGVACQEAGRGSVCSSHPPPPPITTFSMVTQSRRACLPCHWPPNTSGACTGKTCIFGRVGAKAAPTCARCQANSWLHDITHRA
jgi:hypothetical protein